MSYATAAAAVNAALNGGTSRWMGLTDSGGVEVSGPGYSRQSQAGGAYSAVDWRGDSTIAVGWFSGASFFASAAWDRPVERWQIYTASSGAGTELVVDSQALGGVIDWGTWVGTKTVNVYYAAVTALASTSLVRGKSSWELGREVIDGSFTVGNTYWVALFDMDDVELTVTGYARKSFTAVYSSYAGYTIEGGIASAAALDWVTDRAGADWGQIKSFGIFTASTAGTAPLPNQLIFTDYGLRSQPTDVGPRFLPEAVAYVLATTTKAAASKRLLAPYASVDGGPSMVNAIAELRSFLASNVWVGVVDTGSAEPANTSYGRLQPVWGTPVDAYGDGFYVTASAAYKSYLASDVWVDLQKIGLWPTETGGTPIDWYGDPYLDGSLGLGNSSGAQNAVLNGLYVTFERVSGFGLDYAGTVSPTYGTAPTIATPVLTVASAAVLGVSLPFSATCATSIDQMDFAIDADTISSDASAPYTGTWTATAGTHTLRATAVKTGFGVSVSATIPTVAAPTCSMLEPAGGWTVAVNNPVRLGAAAIYEPSVTSVEFFVNGVSVGTSTRFPYSVIYTPASVGSKTVHATATTGAGTVTSADATLVVTAAPSIQPGGWGRQT